MKHFQLILQVAKIVKIMYFCFSNTSRIVANFVKFLKKTESFK
jgi:hypothetical protein